MKTLIQNEKSHKFSSDALLLANFTPLEKVEKFVELGTGCGVITLELLNKKTSMQAIGLDYSKELLETAKKNSSMYFDNEDPIDFLEEDLNFCPNFANKKTLDFKKKCDLVVTNPPWLLENQGKVPSDEIKRKALFAGQDIYKLFFRSAKFFLKEKGLLSFVTIPNRISDALDALNEYGFAPKKMQFVHNTLESDAIFVLCLAEFIGKSANSHELKILPPHILRD